MADKSKAKIQELRVLNANLQKKQKRTLVGFIITLLTSLCLGFHQYDPTVLDKVMNFFESDTPVVEPVDVP